MAPAGFESEKMEKRKHPGEHRKVPFFRATKQSWFRDKVDVFHDIQFLDHGLGFSATDLGMSQKEEIPLKNASFSLKAFNGCFWLNT